MVMGGRSQVDVMGDKFVRKKVPVEKISSRDFDYQRDRLIKKI